MKDYANIVKNLNINTDYLRDNYELIVDLKYEKYTCLTVSIITAGIATWLLRSSMNLISPTDSFDNQIIGLFYVAGGVFSALWSFITFGCACGSQCDLVKERKKNKILERKFK